MLVPFLVYATSNLATPGLTVLPRDKLFLMCLKTTVPINTVLSPFSVTNIKLSIRLYSKKDFREKYYSTGHLGQGGWQPSPTTVKTPLHLELCVK